MAKKVKIELNSPGIREFLRGPEVQGMLSERARRIAGNAGDGYETDVYSGKNRANAAVWAATDRATADNLNNNTLLKAMNGV